MIPASFRFSLFVISTCALLAPFAAAGQATAPQLAIPAFSAAAAPKLALPVVASSSSADDLPDDPSAADQQADPHAVHAGKKGHSETGEPQQTKRILGVMPNFSSVSADEKLPKLSVKDKFLLAGRNSFDYSSFLLAGIQAGIAMNSDSYPEFHQGVAGYGRYYWHTLADTADENFMVAGMFPAVFRQDPRFYTLGHGGFKHRALYAASRILITRSDEGNQMPNYSEIVGAGAAAGVSSLYYPTRYRTWTKVGQKWLTSAVIDSANFTFKEFWPDINHKLFHTH